MKGKEPDWVQLQQKTMIRWVNQKIQNDSDTPTANLTIPCQISNLHTDLGDGLVLIRLVNQIIHDVSNTPHHHLNTGELFYLTPLYPKPNFKLQKIENLNDFLKFIKLILNINVSTVSSDNIFDGDLKLTLGLVWSLFVFSTSTSLMSFSNASPSFVEIKSILANWLNNIVSKHNIQVSNFNKDWSVEIHRPDLILSIILQHYLIVLPEEKNHIQNLIRILEYGEKTLNIPHLIDIDDFRLLVPDEKCIVTYLIEWFKYFEIEKKILEPKSKFNDLVELINITVKFKNKYETKALRFLNRINSFTAQLNQDYMYLENNEGSQATSTLSTTLEMFRTYQTSIKPDLLSVDYPDLKNYLTIINSNLQELDLLYSPLIKHLNMDNLSRKVGILQELEAKISLKVDSVIAKFPSLAKESKIPIITPKPIPQISSAQTYNLNSNLYHNFRAKFVSHQSELTHFSLIKFLRTAIVTLELDSQTLETFIKLLPMKPKLSNSDSSYSINDSDFSLVSSSSSHSITSITEDDFIFDEIQQKLDSQLSGTLDKVYDLVEFIHKLENGFNV